MNFCGPCRLTVMPSSASGRCGGITTTLHFLLVCDYSQQIIITDYRRTRGVSPLPAILTIFDQKEFKRKMAGRGLTGIDFQTNSWEHFFSDGVFCKFVCKK